jgi:hypothetical protein
MFDGFQPFATISSPGGNLSDLIEMNTEMHRILVDAEQLWDAFSQAWRRRKPFEGGITWTTQKGRDDPAADRGDIFFR